jgi:HSP20 family protein
MSLPNIIPLQRKASAASGHPVLRGWDDMHREMDRIFDSFFSDAFSRAPLTSAVAAAVPVALHLDVAETEKAYIVSAELPGLEDKDIDLTLADGVLTLKGEKQQEAETEGKSFHRVERRYGSFKRVLQLPGDADENAINATMKNGVLQIEIGKNQKATPSSRKIGIKTG